MDFDDTPDEAAFRAAAREWLSANAIPKGSPDDFSAGHFAGDTSPEEYIKRCRWWQGQLFEGGWAGIAWPKPFGGRGGKPIEEAIFGEEQAKWGVSVGVFAVAFGMVAPTLMQHARDDQQARFLAPMLRGEELWCQLFSEPDAGSDLASLQTRAVRDGDEFVVNGQKVWTSNAQHSEWGILIARTDPDAPRHRGITYFVVDMSTAGHRRPSVAADERRGALQRGVPQRRPQYRSANVIGESTTGGRSPSRRCRTSGSRSQAVPVCPIPNGCCSWPVRSASRPIRCSGSGSRRSGAAAR